MWPVLASVAFGFIKGLTNSGRERFHPEQDFIGPVKEEFVYRGVPLWTVPTLPYGTTAVTFAVDHVLSDARHDMGMGGRELLARFGDVLLGGVLYETAMRRYGILGAVAAHVSHNVAVGWGSRARRLGGAQLAVPGAGNGQEGR